VCGVLCISVCLPLLCFCCCSLEVLFFFAVFVTYNTQLVKLMKSPVAPTHKKKMRSRKRSAASDAFVVGVIHVVPKHSVRFPRIRSIPFSSFVGELC
jgi:hypothetical protein